LGKNKDQDLQHGGNRGRGGFEGNQNLNTKEPEQKKPEDAEGRKNLCKKS
jgi:hypothetical protein